MDVSKLAGLILAEGFYFYLSQNACTKDLSSSEKRCSCFRWFLCLKSGLVSMSLDGSTLHSILLKGLLLPKLQMPFDFLYRRGSVCRRVSSGYRWVRSGYRWGHADVLGGVLLNVSSVEMNRAILTKTV